MKALLLLFIPTLVFAQNYWSPAVQITPDSIEAFNPSFPDNGRWWSDQQVQLLAYTQVSHGSLDIVVHRSTQRALAWNTTPFRITNDTVRDDFPSIAQIDGYSVTGPKMIVWERARSDIYFSRTNDTVWTQPLPLGTGVHGGRTPYVAVADTVFAAVWENGGRILFSEYWSSAWSAPVFLNEPLDTVNFLPQLKYFYGGNPYRYRPMVIWERRKRATRDRAIAFALRADTGWTAPDTITSVGDNRHPKFVAQGFSEVMISFESNRLGDYCILGASSSLGSAWSVDQQPVSGYVAGKNQTQASFTLFPVITTSPVALQWFWYTAGTWRIESNSGQDSIGVVERSIYTLNLRSGGSGEDRNPVLSTGVFNFGPLRVWSVWQNNSGGTWKLFGSYDDIILDDVKEGAMVNAFQLHQNYPNPFNPTTRIRFTIPVGTGHAPSLLKVHDILGREVATLVNDEKGAGDHQVQFNAENLSSGVYFYKLQVGNFIAVKKLILQK